MMKVLDLYHLPDGRQRSPQPHVHQIHPLPQGALYTDILYIKLNFVLNKNPGEEHVFL